MPITTKEEALKELEETKQRILYLEREKRDLQDSINALQEYYDKLEERWGIGFYGEE